MDREQLIKDFREAFGQDIANKKYSAIWLSFLYFGENHYRLHLKHEHKTEIEIADITRFLSQNGLLRYVQSLRTYNPGDYYYIAYDDIVVYSKTQSSHHSAA